eukprot:scaffold73543_cov68-Phaeocystis_antarctica.AAC.2
MVFQLRGITDTTTTYIHPTDWTALARGFCDGRGRESMQRVARERSSRSRAGRWRCPRSAW